MPRVEWARFSDGIYPEINKSILVWYRSGHCYKAFRDGNIYYEVDDPREEITDEDGDIPWDWKDLTHWAYLCAPIY